MLQRELQDKILTVYSYKMDTGFTFMALCIIFFHFLHQVLNLVCSECCHKFLVNPSLLLILKLKLPSSYKPMGCCKRELILWPTDKC